MKLKAMRGDVPGLLPTHAVVVEEQAHQLGNSDGGVSIIELNGPLFVKVVEALAQETGAFGSYPGASRT